VDPEPNAIAGDDELLDRAWDALDDGDLEAALELASRVDPTRREAWILRASAALEEDDLAGARELLSQARDCGEPGEDPGLLWLDGELDLRSWRIDEARACYERLAELERSPAVLGRLSLCSEILGEFERADELLAEAQRLDPEGWPLPPRLDQEEFEAVIDEAVVRLPREFQEALEETPVLVAPVPSRDLVALDSPAETPPDMLGLFVGASRIERAPDETLELPPAIHLFQRNLERWAQDREELVSEIQVTLYHELAHVLGFDEEGVEALGLE